MALKEELEKQGNWLFKYRSTLPIGILFIGFVVSVQMNLKEETTSCEILYEFACLLISAVGLGIRVYTVGYTPKNTSGRNTSEGQVADTLNTTGIYSVVRNPLYLGNFFMWLGLALFTENLWFVVSFILFYWIYYERIIYAEEQFLERKFGEKYRSWASKVPVFIPNLGLFRKNELSFSLKKVLKKEKNGLFAMFLIFTLFDITGEWIRDHSDHNLLFISGTIITMMMYFVLKVLKMKTKLLENNRS
ncbi:isoprenylcysteine carboxylmethyltransferase family protein [Chryseobacterium sp. B21-037]|uniref:methyltransferase family protein n=1 Tax=Chryseobacterium sp. B21-037 TaxID=2926038 RepID=UPI00235933FE|nr:isoprenylcysteine carboxylmethyltransferase family protein [Chryseobacterium sp. B21-037]MDC8106364.1 isoprenylcysteine carboxylmethyltransferase family protein [Chryseobacterium sp. B21-037]WBV55584.1 isoprenylcysteine carboxylmethyltransferase family protein [Chryseobacterium daecheongense]